MKKLLFLLAFTAFFGNVHAQSDNDRRVIFIMLDGLRWQELFNGADTALINVKRYAVNPKGISALYWRPTQDERRMALMPFTWGYVKQHGLIIGNRWKNSFMQVENKYKFSYPGYSETLCGWADDERISRTFKELKAMGVQCFNLCHCSADRSCKSEAWPADLVPLAGGSTIEVEAKGCMKAAIIYDSRTHTTEKAASFIAEGIHNAGMQPACFCIDEIDEAGLEYIANSNLVIFGSPTYMASVTAKMKTWLEANWQKLNLSKKLGGAFATEQYIHGGGENAIKELLTFMMVQGMLVYSGGNNYGKPIIHLGPVGMSQDIESFRDLFVTYGERMGDVAVSVM